MRVNAALPHISNSTYKNICYTLAGKAISIGIAGIVHPCILLIILEKLLETPIDDFFIGSNELQCACCNSLGALGGIPHD